MFKLNNISIRKRIYGILTFIFLCITFIYFLSVRNINEMNDTAVWIHHTHEVIVLANKIVKDMVDMETGQRGFMVTGNDVFLEPFIEGKKRIDMHLDEAIIQVNDNPPQVQRFKHIAELKNEWLTEAGEFEIDLKRKIDAGKLNPQAIINILEGKDIDGSPQHFGHMSGKDIMDSIRVIIDEIIQIEEELLFEREKDNESSIAQTKLIILYSSLFTIIISLIFASYIISNLIKSINLSKKFTEDVIGGEYNKSYEVDQFDEIGKLINNIHKMTIDLKGAKEENETQNWLSKGIEDLNELIREEENKTNLAKNTCSFLAKYLNVQIITFYTFENDYLKLTGSYAFNKRKDLNEKIRLGEGFVGQAAIEKEIISLTSIPEDYIRINSSLGDTAPRNIVVVPIMYNQILKGVIEIGSFEEVDDKKLSFLSQIEELLGISLNTIESKHNLQNALEESQVQAEELEEKTEKLQAIQVQLQAQQEELKANNEELEEKTQALSEQKRNVEKNNRLLEDAKYILEQKTKELEITSKYKSEFLANMSHELRTPLNSLLLLSKKLCDNKDGNLSPKQVKNAGVIYNSGSDLLHMINEILDLSKIEAGQMNIISEEISLSNLIDELESMFAPIAKNKSLDFDIELGKNIVPKINNDEQKLKQILKNLISNALKFTETGGVKIKIHQAYDDTIFFTDGLDSSNTIVFDVIDTGIGIPNDKLMLIFEAFQQADGSTSRTYGGTGLGLSISRELAKLLGGEIKVKSKENEGSTFSLVIKTDLVADTAPVTSKSPEQQNQVLFNDDPVSILSSKQIDDDKSTVDKDEHVILIIEDDVRFAELLYDVIKEKDFKCIHAVTGEEGLQLASTHNVLGIILDLNLPGINGLQVLDQLKQDVRTRHIPVHIMSAYDSPDNLGEKETIGFLQKPVDPDKMDEAIQKLISRGDDQFKNILIVEDDEKLSYSIKELLDRNNFQIEISNSGKDALDKLKSKTYNGIILDLNLSGFDGFKIIDYIKSKISNLPIIVYTGKELSEEEKEKLTKNTSTVIKKEPASDERLLDEVSLFLHSTSKAKSSGIKMAHSSLTQDDNQLKNKKVLIVDDDIRNLYALEEELADLNMIVDKAPNGKVAIDKLIENPSFDIILMDIMMPVMDGYEAMKNIRKNDKIRNIPIIAITAKAMKEDRQKCINAGADDYLSKPIEMDKLINLIKVWIKK